MATPQDSSVRHTHWLTSTVSSQVVSKSHLFRAQKGFTKYFWKAKSDYPVEDQIYSHLDIWKAKNTTLQDTCWICGGPNYNQLQMEWWSAGKLSKFKSKDANISTNLRRDLRFFWGGLCPLNLPACPWKALIPSAEIHCQCCWCPRQWPPDGRDEKSNHGILKREPIITSSFCSCLFEIQNTLCLKIGRRFSKSNCCLSCHLEEFFVWLVGVQPLTLLLSHLVGNMVIFCSFAHHWIFKQTPSTSTIQNSKLQSKFFQMLKSPWNLWYKATQYKAICKTKNTWHAWRFKKAVFFSAHGRGKHTNPGNYDALTQHVEYTFHTFQLRPKNMYKNQS